jgi:hypothetical protein
LPPFTPPALADARGGISRCRRRGWSAPLSTAPASWGLVHSNNLFVQSGVRPLRAAEPATLPESRLLARFLEATNLTGSLQTLRDLNMQSNTHTIGEVQTKVEWLEVFIVGFYATERANIVMHHVRLPHWGSVLTILAVGLVFTCATAFVLEPWKHATSKRPFLILLLLIILSAGRLLLTWYRPAEAATTTHSDNQRPRAFAQNA